MQKIYGYIRVSNDGASENTQLFNLVRNGIPTRNIYLDRQAEKGNACPSLDYLIHQKLRPGDLIVVGSLDRLGASYRAIAQRWDEITKSAGADIRVLSLPLVDTSRDKARLGPLVEDLVAQLLSFVSENERGDIRQRQAEGIAAAKRNGVRFGRPRTPMPDNFDEVYQLWKSRKITPAAAFRMTGLPRHTFYRIAQNYHGEQE